MFEDTESVNRPYTEVGQKIKWQKKKQDDKQWSTKY